MNFRNKKLKSTTVHWSGRQDKSKLHQLLEKVEESFSSSVSFQELKSPAAVRPNGNFGRSFSIPSDMGSTKMTPVLDVPTHRSLFLAPVMMDPINEKENIPTVVTNSKEDFDAFSDFDDGLLSFELEAAIQLAEVRYYLPFAHKLF